MSSKKIPIKKLNTINISKFKTKIHGPEVNFGDKDVNLTLPAIFKVIDKKKFEESKLAETKWVQKIDQKGRIFYVNDPNDISTFKHPELKKKTSDKGRNSSFKSI